MLLEELTTNDLNLLAKVLSQMTSLGGWEKLDRFAYNPAALKEAVALYNWALHDNGTDFTKQYDAFSHLLATRSMGGTRSALRVLQPTGFIERNQLINILDTEAIVSNPTRFRNARQEAVGFIKATRSLFYSLKCLGDVATPDTKRHNANDGLNHKLAKATLHRLGITAGHVYVKA